MPATLLPAEPLATVSPMTTTVALQRLANGRDADAWAAILQRHGPNILRLAQRIAGDAALADDICQETLLQIRAHAGQFRPLSSPAETEAMARGWIMRITCCTALKMLRFRKRSSQRDAAAAAASAAAYAPSAEDAVLSLEQSELVRREVAALPDGLRIPVCLHFYGDVSYDELGVALDCSQDAAKKRVQRGVERLRSRLACGGLIVGASALMSALAGAPAHAAEAVPLALDTQRFAAWQALLHSPSAPVLTGVATLGGITVMTKCVFGAVAVLLFALIGVQAVHVNSLEKEAQEARAAAAAASATTEKLKALEAQLAGCNGEVAALKAQASSRSEELSALQKKIGDLEKRPTAQGPGAPLEIALPPFVAKDAGAVAANGIVNDVIKHVADAAGNVRFEGINPEDMKIVINGVEIPAKGGNPPGQPGDKANPTTPGASFRLHRIACL